MSDPRKPTLQYRPLATRLPDGRIEVLVGASVCQMKEEAALKLFKELRVVLGPTAEELT